MNELTKALLALHGGAPLFTAMYLLLAFLLIFDWITGSAAARKEERHNSQGGINGILRTFVVLWIPLAGTLLDFVIGRQSFKVNIGEIELILPGLVFSFLIISLCYNVAISFIANTVRAGWDNYIPAKALSIFLKLAKQEIEHKMKKGEKK